MSKQSRKETSKVGLAIGVLVLILISWSTMKMLHLKYYGKIKEGTVQSVYKVGSKGRYNCEYSFYLDDKLYQGDAIHKGFKIGDSVVVLYSPFYPSINTLQQKVFDDW